MTPTFTRFAADILGNTNSGLTGPDIIKLTVSYGAEYGVDVPNSEYPFEGNKRSALFDNLMVFQPKDRYRAIKELTELLHARSIQNGIDPSAVQKLRVRLFTEHGDLDDEADPSVIDGDLLAQTRHWLQPYPEVHRLYEGALDKYGHGVLDRNLLDDLRLALEELLRVVLNNRKRLEVQTGPLGSFLKERGASPLFTNMVQPLLAAYGKYQNEHVKHGDRVVALEVSFIVEVTSALMKHVVRMADVSSENPQDEEDLSF